MSKKNKRYTKPQTPKEDIYTQDDEVVRECNTAEISLPEDEQMVAGENNIDDVELDKHDIDEQAMEFDYYQQQLDAERTNLEMYKKMAQQLQADFDNYRKRNATIASDSKKEGIADAVTAMLPAYDALVEGLRMITDENVKKGLEMVERVFLQSLADLHIHPIIAKGQPFDPKYHNALMTEEAEGVESGIVLDEFSKGFIKDDGSIIRVATVKIAK